jgi:hypothetical protein
MNTTENNKLIAEFMGHKIDWGFNKDSILYMPQGEGNATNNSVVIGLDKLEYHTSWEWLMPVFKRIHELPLEEIEGSYKIHAFSVKIDGIYCSVSHGRTGEIIVEDDSGDMFDNLYCVIVEFIKWYNNRKDIEDNMAHDFDREPDF